MAGPSETQRRLVYSLLKPVVRIAARFGIPVRSLAELVKLAYFEHLRQEQGLPHAAVAERMGQTDRSMRSLERRLRSDFFAAETKVGLPRAIEDWVAQHRPTEAALVASLAAWEPDHVRDAAEGLIKEGRISREGEHLQVSKQYVTLTSSGFPERIDALNHHLDGLTHAIVQRLIFNQRTATMIKTVSFVAREQSVAPFAEQLQTELREGIARLEREAESEGDDTRRYTLGLTLAPRSDEPAK